MKNALLLILILPVFVAGQVSSDTVERKTFKDSKYPFSLSFPVKWKVNELETDEARLVLVYDSKTIVATFNMNVEESSELADTTGSSFADEMLDDPEGLREMVTEDDPTAKFEDAKKITIGKYDALGIWSSYDDVTDGVKLRISTFLILLLDDGLMYMMNFSVQQSEYDSMRSDIDKIANSLKITKKEGQAN